MMESKYFTDPTVRKAVDAWQRANDLLDAIRKAELVRIDVSEELQSLAELFEDAVRRIPPEPTSGLVDQQAWFKKLRDEISA